MNYPTAVDLQEMLKNNLRDKTSHIISGYLIQSIEIKTDSEFISGKFKGILLNDEDSVKLIRMIKENTDKETFHEIMKVIDSGCLKQ